MATGGVLGDGAKVAYSASSPVSWTKVGQLLNVDYPGLTATKVDTTVHGSAGIKRSIRGLKEATPMKITVLADLDPATTPSHAALRAYQLAGTTLWWRIEIPTDREKTTFAPREFQGYVNTFLPKTPIEGRQEIEMDIEFDGDGMYDLAVGASAIS